MPIRNPFARKPGPVPANDEYLNPSNAPASQPAGFERVDTKGSKASSALSLGSTRSQDTGEYKMSVVNDSGVYLPPSPTEEKGQWPRQYISRKSTETRSSIGDIEPFSISRESFDSYRRSFDVSARTPVTTTTDMPTRQSLDSARFARPPRSAINGARKMEVQPPTAEENFEDVGLEDKPARKHGFFSKFSNAQTPDRESSPQPTMSRFLPGRKRGQSGQGAELGAMDHPKVMVTTHDNQ